MSNADVFLFHMLKGGVDKRTRDAIGLSMAHTLKRALNFPAAAMSQSDQNVVNLLERRGFSPFDPIFSASELDEIDAYFSDKPISFSTSEMNTDYTVRGFAADRPPELRFGNWEQETVSACPAFGRVAHDLRLLQIAEAYLKAPPTITFLTVWWSYPSSAIRGGMQNYHHDRDDFRSLKLFAYLTDTSETSGPHQFVEETHSFETLVSFIQRQKWTDPAQYEAFLQWMEVHRKKDHDVTEYFPKENIRTITGARGTTFFEDTRGLHRGVPPLSSPRLAFEICYSLNPKHNQKYNAVPRPSAVGQISAGIAYATRLFYQE